MTQPMPAFEGQTPLVQTATRLFTDNTAPLHCSIRGKQACTLHIAWSLLERFEALASCGRQVRTAKIDRAHLKIRSSVQIEPVDVENRLRPDLAH